MGTVEIPLESSYALSNEFLLRIITALVSGQIKRVQLKNRGQGVIFGIKEECRQDVHHPEGRFVYMMNINKLLWFL